jgi:hypothetical protein
MPDRDLKPEKVPEWQAPLREYVRVEADFATPLTFAQCLRWRVFLKVSLPTLAEVLGGARG